MRSFLRVLSIILLVLWMALIFNFSHQNANASSNVSGQFIEAVAEKFYPNFEDLTQEEKIQIVEGYQFIARKTAHIGIYAILGFFAFLSLISYVKLKFFTRFAWANVICFLYAASDEIHQNYVWGRSCELRDFLLDCFGVLIMILLCTVFVKIIPPLRRKTAYAGFSKKDLLRENYYLHKELKETADSNQRLYGVISDYKTQIEELKARLEGNTLDVVPEEALEITETIIIDPKSLEDDELPEIKIEIEDDESDESEIFEETTIPELPEISETEDPQKAEDNSAVEEALKQQLDVIQLSSEMSYAATVIGQAVIKVTKLCNELVKTDEQNEMRKELVNLALGRTEILKSEIHKILQSEIPFDEKKELIEKERDDAYDYFDSIIAQIS
jgi:VanZ family protein